MRWMAALVIVMAGPMAAGAQWLNYPTPGIPRLPNGAPNLKAPAPRTPMPMMKNSSRVADATVMPSLRFTSLMSAPPFPADQKYAFAADRV